MPDGAAETIQALSKNYLLGIVTSRIQNSVWESPTLAKLKKYFRTAVAYEDTENHKPDPEPLLLAAKRLGVSADECVYIGDVENDIKAALAAGMKSILFSKKNILGANANTFDFKAIPELVRTL
jgi:HAD superfamily hydrolase (TIGR01549 family)